MDLKALLLQSTSTDKTLCFRTRCHIGKKCYTIGYEVNRKFLKLTLIRRVRSKLNHSPNDKPPTLKCKGPRVHMRRHQTYTTTEYWNRGTQTDRAESKRLVEPITIYMEHQTQTEVAKTNKRIQTNAPTQCNKDQQTKHRKHRHQGAQTEHNLNAMSSQTEYAMVSRSQTTEPVQTASMPCQTEVFTNSVVTQTEASQIEKLEHMTVERDAVVLMINEMGEMLINQNALLNNNSTLLCQLTEHSILQGQFKRQQATAKEKQYPAKNRKFAAPKAKHRWKFSPKMCPSNKTFKIFEPPERRDKAVQVDMAKSCSNTWTQTERGAGDEVKRRLSSWKMFNKNN